MGYVLDASALLKLVLDDHGHEALRAWFREQVRARAELTAPTLVSYEVGSVLQRVFPDLQAHERGAMHGDLVRAVHLVEVPVEASFRHADRGLTFYDAAYLALAEARGDTLVTGDTAVVEAARAAGVATELA